MLRRFGWFYRILGLGVVLDRVRFEDHSTERIRTAAAHGPVVYVLLHRSTLDHLALNTVLNRRRLPLSVWAHGATSFYWQPVAEAWRDVFRRIASRLSAGPRPNPVASGWLARTIAAGQPVTIFLQDGVAQRPAEQDPILAVLKAQEQTERPIQMVPVICVWDRAPEQGSSTVRDFLLGSRERPNLLTKLSSLYLPQRRRPFVQVGEPLDVQQFVDRVSPERRRDSLRTLLRRYLKREGHVVRGPRLLPRPVLKGLVLDAPPMRRFAEEEAERTGQSVEKVREAMSKEFDTIAASFSWGVIRFFSYALKPMFTRVFSGYDIRDEDLERIRTATRNGTAVLVPCHKSHVDYLLMSWVLYHDDLVPPHVVAGINLAIWPVSLLLRGAGGFFIRRSFAGQQIHPKVFSRYLRELLLHGYTVEFFIEGGRTRTGRLLPPRTGVLDMVLEAADTAPKGHEITLLPMALAYEQVAEEGAYRSELGGKAKREESVGELIKARSVLKRRFGKVYVRVGEPVLASDVIRDGWTDLDRDDRRERLAHTGDLLVHRIGEAMVVLPTSLVALGLLAHHREGIAHDALMARVRRLHTFLERRGAVMSDSLARYDQAIASALDRFLREGLVRRLGEGETRVWDIVPERRVTLDLHKNQVLHLFAEAGATAAALRARDDDGAFRADILDDDVGRLLRLWSREFTLDPDLDDAARRARGLDDLQAHGAVAADHGWWRVSDAERIGEIHSLFRSLLEPYRAVLEGTEALAEGRYDRRSWAKHVQGESDRLMAAGILTRPEGVSAVTLKHAVYAWRDAGVFTGDEALSVDPERLAEARAFMAGLVGA